MKKSINSLFMKLGVVVFMSLFFQGTFLQTSQALEMTPFYKSWLEERSYTHPSLKPKSQPSSVKKMAQPKAVAKATHATPKIGKEPFYKSWLQERSYTHPGIESIAASSTPVKNIAETAPSSAKKKITPKHKKMPEFNICNFVCLSTCKTCNSSSSNYLMSKE
jgi:hypothetical protein